MSSVSKLKRCGWRNLHDLTLAQSGHDSGRCRRWLNVLPVPQHPPTSCAQFRVCGPIPLDILPEFGNPIVLIGLRNRPMFRATMPEAAIHEHCYPEPGERDVGADCLPMGHGDRVVLPESEPPPMQEGAQHYLRLRVRSAIAAHLLGRDMARWLRVRKASHYRLLMVATRL